VALKAKIKVVPVVFQQYTNLQHSERWFDPAVIKVLVLEPLHADSDSSESVESTIVESFVEKKTRTTRMIQQSLH